MLADTAESDEIPPVFELEMTVSGGTYVRSIVHDLGIAVGSAAHVVTLTRSRQGQFSLDSDTTRPIVEPGYENEAEGDSVELHSCVDWAILEQAILLYEAGDEIEKNEDGWSEWELEILKKWPE